MDIKGYMKELACSVKSASSSLGKAKTEDKNLLLEKMADLLLKNETVILNANKKDLAYAKDKGLPAALCDRLLLTHERIVSMANSLREIAMLKDPIGEVISAWRNKDDLWIQKVRVPIGVVGIIYEARPNVTADCIGLCIKSGNSVILKGGKEAINSNLAIFSTLKEAFSYVETIDSNCIGFIETTDREAVAEMLRFKDYIDLIIPRGGEGLIKFVMEHSLIPVIKHYKGVCHEYVDESADLDMAVRVCYNAKVQRPGVCNSVEKIIVHRAIAEKFLPKLAAEFEKVGVEIRGCEITKRYIDCKFANDSDWYKEYLDLIVAVKVVNSIEEAIRWINEHGSHHSDGIITSNYQSALEFVREVDSAAVYVNASTRFTDGGVFGLGAEIGISTDKLHARGPMGVEELTTYKYVVFGEGQIRK